MDIFQQLFAEPSLPHLFILSFLAATIIPIGSEWLLIFLLINGEPPQQTVLVATLGNYLGACTTYWVGLLGSDLVISKLLRIDKKQMKRAEKLYSRYGIWSLLLSWLPVIGDPLCLLGGIFRIQFIYFSFLVFLGKFTRYATLAFFVFNHLGD